MRRLDSATPLRCARNDPVNKNRVACSQPWLFAQTPQRFPINPCYLFRTAVGGAGRGFFSPPFARQAGRGFFSLKKGAGRAIYKKNSNLLLPEIVL
jgi:hypothetical protein